MDTPKFNQQLQLEMTSLDMGRERFMAAVERDLEQGRLGTASDRILRSSMERGTVAIRKLQAELLTTMRPEKDGGARGKRVGAEPLILSVGAEVVAYIAIRSVLTLRVNERSVTSVALRVAKGLADHLWLTEVTEAEKHAAKARSHLPGNRIPWLRRELAKYGPRMVRRWRQKLSDLPTTEWTTKQKLWIGTTILAAIRPAISEWVDFEGFGVDGVKKYVRVKSVFVEMLIQESERLALLYPFYLPMIHKPEDWTIGKRTLVGGYLSLKADGLKVGHNPHTTPEDIGKEHLDAMNSLQSVPWVVNGFVLEHARRAFQTDMGPVPYEPELPLPQRVSDTDWEAMTKEERTPVLYERARVYDHNHHQAEVKISQFRAITIADMFKDEEALYFPHAMDYRGRFYPIPQDLHPQGPDMVKAMLMFAESKPLGERGLVWLEQHAANTYGLDKEDRTTQQMWVSLNWDRIMLVGSDPWLDVEFWEGADEPWQFLAAAHELLLANQCEDPARYESSLVVSVDGSCNGLQHLSAMGLDPVGGAAVNLVQGERQDIYQIVADKVSSSLPVDSVWHGRVTRKTVKRAVMTTPYGVTKAGIADQQRAAGFCRNMTDPITARHELRDYILDALDGTIVKGVEIMGWFKDVAKVLSQDAKGVAWETPTGSVIRMKYQETKDTRVTTPMGRLRLNLPEGKCPKVATVKQTNSVSPNIIHSFDASHLALVILRFEGVVGAVHDSYGTHACDVDELLEATKEEFINIYSRDWFGILRASFIFHSDRPSVPQAPKRGGLDITDVRASNYFFA